MFRKRNVRMSLVAVAALALPASFFIYMPWTYSLMLLASVVISVGVSLLLLWAMAWASNGEV